MSKSLLEKTSIKDAYLKLKNKPLGLWFLSRIFGWFIPYTGSISPRIEMLAPGYARVGMFDKRRVRNHLNSIHAVALMNLGEATTGLALHYDMPSNRRAILTHLSMDYLKKARGNLFAEAKCEIHNSGSIGLQILKANIFDASNNLVATAHATWLVSNRS